MEVCGGDRQKSENLFWYCDWQHPSSAWDEGAIDSDEPDVGQKSIDVVICVEQGRVSEVYASSKCRVHVDIIDSDTDDLDRQADIGEELRQLKVRVSGGELVQIV